MKYVNLVIDNKSNMTDTFYTYGCEFDDVSVGDKVYVSFGKGKNLRTGYVFQVMNELERDFKNLKYVREIDREVSLTPEIVRTCVWMKKRFSCRYIDAIRQFVPAGKGLKSGELREPLADTGIEIQNIEKLTPEQEEAIASIKKSEGFDMFLLHGVTGSGKTEVYMRVIEDVLRQGKKAIMMVPEISLTKQITDRFAGRFGVRRIAVLHSRLSLGERHDEWIKLRSGQVDIVIGARSAVFAPMENVGVIIMDEEHEGTYKSDQTPKYETVDVAARRAKDMNCKLILGSATPSIVSYKRSLQGIYKKLTLKSRYNMTALPDIETVDMRNELKQGNTGILSERLFSQMRETIDAGKQVILLLNRRGYSPFVACRDCGYVIKCEDCDISMTYHKNSNACICHYCGKMKPLPKKCPQCGGNHIRHFGAGTEKLEEAIKAMFPENKIERMDFDTIKRKGSLAKILERFGSGKTKILIGTQIVAKGLDFKNVGLVGIVSADMSLNIPDYRSGERTFQLITQAAGRSGRGDERGKVIIQTYTPDNYVITAAKNQNYEEFFNREIVFRKARCYPPYSDIIQLVFSGKDEQVVVDIAETWQRILIDSLGKDGGKVLPHGGFFAGGSRDIYKENILIKCPKGKRYEYLGIIEGLKKESNTGKSKFNVVVDINPYSMWRN